MTAARSVRLGPCRRGAGGLHGGSLLKARNAGKARRRCWGGRLQVPLPKGPAAARGQIVLARRERAEHILRRRPAGRPAQAGPPGCPRSAAAKK